MKNTTIFFASVAVCLISFSSASSEVVRVIDPGTVQVTSEVNPFSVFGEDMVGMQVTAKFDDNSSETLDWGSFGDNNGGVFGTGWAMWFTADSGTGTYSNYFGLYNGSGKRLKGFHMDGGPGSTVFDRTFRGNRGTAGSSLGRDFTTSSYLANDPNTITAIYSDVVRLNDNAPVGDIYRSLWVDLGRGLRSGKKFYFKQDTDKVLDLTPVPEPSSFALFSLFVAGTTMTSRRRKSKI